MYMIVEVSQYVAVASFSEAWIEIKMQEKKQKEEKVASFSEAWIEIDTAIRLPLQDGSPPSRRRGLKLKARLTRSRRPCRLLLGGVD